MMKFGFEREFFLVKQNQFILCPREIPHDACGYLVEARSEPHADALKAAYLLLAEEDRLRRLLPKGLHLKCVDTVELPLDFVRAALREFGKNRLTPERGSLYGLDYEAGDKFSRAGLHVHFSNLLDVEWKDGRKQSVSQMINLPAWIRQLDRAFEKEIKAAKRLPGLYEMKVHGFEYRSLPATIDVRKVAAVLAKAQVAPMLAKEYEA